VKGGSEAEEKIGVWQVEYNPGGRRTVSLANLALDVVDAKRRLEKQERGKAARPR
jgi:hypothetical protein